MDLEHLLTAEGIGRAALELGEPARAEFVEQKCGGDLKLRAEVEFFLRMQTLPHATETAEAAEKPDATGAVETPSRLARLAVGRIGGFRVLEQIGQGGFGVVYLAEQESPVRRRVALKVIKLGMDTPEVLARFEAERQALAMMDHPGVARVFDAGTTEQGRPYFAMEFVPGVPLIEYCDKNRLSNRSRLELFIQVCEAIQHAHQKGIIHRDLKPSNILVTIQDERPVPKVIDFGIAKALHQRLTEHTIHTERGQIIGTPEYMSPEQAEMSGLDIDTRTDIYSLGVILYQLLIGTLPFDSTELRKVGLLEIQRVIRDLEPTKPSTKLGTLAEASRSIAHNRGTDPDTLIRQVRGDLDWITLKAMEKDRTRRYASASELAADVGRYLRDEPILARPPTATYRARKFVRRNRGLVFGGATVVSALLIGLGLATWGFVRERVGREQAARERDRAVAAEGEAQRLLSDSFARSAELARQRGRWRDAIGDYEKAIAAGHPGANRMRLGLIECYWAMMEEKKAERIINELAAQSNLGELAGSVSLSKAEVALNQGKNKRAQKLVDEAIAQGLGPADEAYARALLAATVPLAVEQLEKAVRFDPFHHRARQMLGGCYYYAGRSDRALEQFAITCEMYPEDRPALVLYAVALAMQGSRGDAEGAVELTRSRFGDAMAKDLGELVGFLASFRGAEQSGDTGNPVADTVRYLQRCTQLITLMSRTFEKVGFDYYQLPPAIESLKDMPKAMALSTLGQHRQSVKMLRGMVKAVPIGDLRLILAIQLRKGGRLDEAADEIWGALDGAGLVVYPRSLAMRLGLALEQEIVKRDSGDGARVFRRREQLVRAVRGLDSGTRYGSLGPAAARLAVELGEYETAERLIGDMLRANERDVAALLLLAELELARGANGPAIEAAAAALKIEPKNREARRALDEAVRSMGLVGRRGAGVPVEEYLAREAAARPERRRATTASAPVDESE